MLLNIRSLFVAGLRGSTLLAKLVFTIVLARFLSIVEFGHWVLIVAVISYGIFVIGAEIYNLSLRTYIRDGYDAAAPKFSAQWTYFVAVYGVLILAGAAVSHFSSDRFLSYAFVIALILVLEHATQELHRLAFFRDHQVHANAILLVKSALWMVPTAAYFAWRPQGANLAFVLHAWLAGAAACALYAFVIYRQVFQGLKLVHLQRYSGRLGRGFKMLVPFVIIAIALRTPLLADRYMIEHFAGSAQVGAYGYYATFGNGIQAIFDALILARLTPRLLSGRRSHDEHIALVFRFLRETALFWMLAIAGLYIAIPYVNVFVGKESLQEAFSLLLLLAVGQMIFSLASVVHYGLYALDRDRQLTTGAVAYMAMCLALFGLLIPRFGNYGAGAALLVAGVGLMAIRIRQMLRPDLPSAA